MSILIIFFGLGTTFIISESVSSNVYDKKMYILREISNDKKKVSKYLSNGCIIMHAQSYGSTFLAQDFVIVLSTFDFRLNTFYELMHR